MKIKLFFQQHKEKIAWSVLLLWLLIFNVVIFWPIIRELLLRSWVFDGWALDGAFQVFNPLYRLTLSQEMGADFFFFHGMGTLWLHEPLFWLLGADFMAAELSKNFLNFGVFLLSTGALFRVLGMKWKHLGVLLPLLALVFLEYVPEVIYANHNTIGVRTFFPVLAGAGLLWMLGQKIRGFFRLGGVPLLTSLIVALTFFISVEQGMALGLALGLLWLIFPLYSLRWWERVFVSGIYAVGVIGLTWGLFALVSPEHYQEILNYALRVIPTDQFWYFGAPPHGVLTDIRDFWSLKLFVGYLLVGLGLVGAWGKVFFSPKTNPSQKTIAALFLAFGVYGLISTLSVLGYVSTFPFINLQKLNILSALVLTLGLCQHYDVWNKLRKIYGDFFLRLRKNPRKILRPSLGVVIFLFLSLAGALGAFHVNEAWYGWLMHWIMLAKLVVFLSVGLAGAVWLFPLLKPRTFQFFLLIFVSSYFVPSWSLAGIDPELRNRIAKQEHQMYPSWYNNFSALEAYLGSMPHFDYGLRPDGVSNTQRKRMKPQLATTFFLAPDALKNPPKKYDCLQIGAENVVKVVEYEAWPDKAFLRTTPLEPLTKKSAENCQVLSFSAQTIKQDNLWATYANVLFTGYGVTNPAPDYIIHALGEYRKQYAGDFATVAPRFVIDIQTDLWKNWLMNNHWDYYQQLFTSYEPRVLASDFVLWERKEEPSNELLSWQPQVVEKNGGFSLPRNEKEQPQLGVVRVTYRTANVGEFLPIIGRTPRFWLAPTVENEAETEELLPISLPPAPETETVTFPVLLKPDQAQEIIPQNISPFGWSTEFEIISADFSWFSLDHRYFRDLGISQKPYVNNTK